VESGYYVAASDLLTYRGRADRVIIELKRNGAAEMVVLEMPQIKGIRTTWAALKAWAREGLFT
jgi:hypothetical protein